MKIQGTFPDVRLRRLRSSAWLRDMVQEHRLHASDLIWPLFVQEGKNKRTSVKGLAGVERLSIDQLVKEAKEAAKLGIPAIALFPVTDPKLKTADGREAWNKKNLVCRAIEEVKSAVPEIGVIADVALDPYTTHGHDGVLNKAGDVDNDATVEKLVKQALTLASAGCDVLAPSDMMDGRVKAIRTELPHTPILAYAAKYASAFYGPFREAVGSKSNLGKADKRTYQMNPANSDEALREVAQDIAEGADMVMVKPGTLYLDIIARVRAECNVPVFAYHVSGEYAMLKAAAEAGMLDEQAALMETMIAFKRAGATGILTYAAKDLAKAIVT
ncbi:MAG: porphobilinogen synthase [Alphaproteobacteria bacterium]|nr:porphobilinogen synthase [Alphaproteobacteria bacterium]